MGRPIRTYVSARRAVAILGVHHRLVGAVCRRGGCRVLELPGVPPRYNREDLKALMARSVKRYADPPPP